MKVITPIIIAVYGDSPWLKGCVESIKKYTINYRLIIVDTLRPVRISLAAAWNKALMPLQKNNELFAVILNDDTKVTSNWLTNLLTVLYQQHDVAVVVPTITACANKYQKAPFLQLKGKDIENYTDEEIEAVSKHIQKKFAGQITEMNSHANGSCIALRMDAFYQVNGFCEEFKWAYGEDWHFFDKLLFNRWRIFWRKDAFVWHYGGQTGKIVPDLNRNFTNKLYRQKLSELITKGYRPKRRS